MGAILEEVNVAVFEFVEEELGEVEVGLGVADADVGFALGDGLPDGGSWARVAAFSPEMRQWLFRGLALRGLVRLETMV